MTPVAVVGTGPATDALTAAFSEAAITVEHQQDHRDLEAEFTVVVDRAGGDTIQAVAGDARASGRWAAVELGGVAGYPVVDAAVTVFGPESGCYDCLEARVGATAETTGSV